MEPLNSKEFSSLLSSQSSPPSQESLNLIHHNKILQWKRNYHQLSNIICLLSTTLVLHPTTKFGFPPPANYLLMLDSLNWTESSITKSLLPTNPHLSHCLRDLRLRQRLQGMHPSKIGFLTNWCAKKTFFFHRSTCNEF